MGESRPPGWHSITPRIMVPDAEGLVGFIKQVFEAVGDLPAGRPAELRIGDSIVMVSGAEQREPMTAFLYVYVVDADATYQRALAAGALPLEEPADMPYGDRRGNGARRLGQYLADRDLYAARRCCIVALTAAVVCAQRKSIKSPCSCAR